MCILFMVWALLVAASEATTASKQPRRSNLISDLKSVTSITYVSMSIWAPTGKNVRGIKTHKVNI